MIKRIIIGESGGPTPVIDWEVAGILHAAKTHGIEVYGAINGMEGILHAEVKGNIVNLTDNDPIQFIYNGPGAGLGTTRIKPKEEEYKKIAKNIAILKCDAIIYIGGNDSADQLLGLTKFSSLKAIHAIKTVDNDLPVTHHCPGFGSAALFNAIALKNVTYDFSSYLVRGKLPDGKQGVLHAPVVIYQVMGRKAGWLAQATAFARIDPRGKMIEGEAPHLILSKEIPFDKDEFLKALSKTISTYGEAVVVVQEDLTDKKTGKSIAEVYGEVELDQHKNIQHGRATSFSTGIFLAQLATKELKVKAVAKIKEAVLVPQHIQRSYEMSHSDAAEAYEVGWGAVEALLNGKTKKSVVLKKSPQGKMMTDLTDLSNIAKKERCVELKYIKGMYGPTQEFVDEFLPLIGGPIAIPHYSMMKFPVVALGKRR